MVRLEKIREIRSSFKTRCFGLKRIEFWIEKIKGKVGEEYGSGWIRV